MLASYIQQLLKNDYKLEFTPDAIEKLREASARIATELIETTETIRLNQRRSLRKDDVRWVMDDLRTNDSEAAIMKRLENHCPRDMPFDDHDNGKDREIYKAFVPMKSSLFIRRNAQLAIKERLTAEQRKKKELPSLPQKQRLQSNQLGVEEKTKYQQIFYDEEDIKQRKILLPTFK